MRVIVVGFGVQGKKRSAIAGPDLVCTVDPVNVALGAQSATKKSIEQVALDSFDAALVCTPDETKLDLLRYLLSNKKHVLVEKPLLATDSKSLHELRELARANNVALYTAYNHRFEPHIARARQVLDSGVLGKPYLLRMFYGNGTARDVRLSAWRDKGMGVLSDIGSHLLDIVLFVLNDRPQALKLLRSMNAENLSCDYVCFGTEAQVPHVSLEATLLSWRNSFTFDLLAENGSMHIDCLCKWGPSTFRLRKRVLPSGRPSEETETLEQADPTWELEYRHFIHLCETAGSNIENDIWINDSLKQLSGALT